MEYIRKNDVIYLRLEKGEEIISSLCELSEKENISSASVTGIGATDDVTVGVFLTKTKQYKQNTYNSDFEITSLTGTITRKDLLPYIHIHCSFANLKECFGGHLNRAVVSATAEIVITVFDGIVGRKFNENIGLNLFDF